MTPTDPVDRLLASADPGPPAGPDAREILTLTAWDGLTADQPWAVVKVSAAAVRKRLEQARRRLAKELATEGVAITPRLRVATAER